MRHFSDEGCNPAPDYDSAIAHVVDEEEKKYYSWLNNGNSLLHHDDVSDPMTDYETHIHHFQD